MRFFIILLSLTNPIPAGVFMPCLFLGAWLGRVIGYFFSFFFSVRYIGMYAVIGSIAFTATATHTISPWFVIFEINGQLKHMLPSLIVTLFSYIVGTSITMSLYDVTAKLKQLRYLHVIRNEKIYKLKAK